MSSGGTAVSSVAECRPAGMRSKQLSHSYSSLRKRWKDWNSLLAIGLVHVNEMAVAHRPALVPATGQSDSQSFQWGKSRLFLCYCFEVVFELLFMLFFLLLLLLLLSLLLLLLLLLLLVLLLLLLLLLLNALVVSAAIVVLILTAVSTHLAHYRYDHKPKNSCKKQQRYPTGQVGQVTNEPS